LSPITEVRIDIFVPLLRQTVINGC
jgi:hypothetical protein